MYGESVRYNINHHYITAWDGIQREDYLKKKNNKYFRERKYENLLEYFCNEIGVSQEKNVCALSIDLARKNNITMGKLFMKYQG
jgi:hypothetical protein